jgi:3,4-dihydroxy-2-butanone 4-phosphate synthase
MSVPQNRMREHGPTDLVETTAAAMAAGQPVVLFEDRICAIAIAAERVDADKITDLAVNARGVISVAMAAERLDALGIPPIERSPGSRRQGHAVSVDAIVGTTTGISAADRATTVRALLAKEHDGRIAAPGHVTPIRAADGGVLERPGIAEAAVALAEVAGLEPVVCLCEILDDDGAALDPEGLAGHPRYSTLPAISPLLVRAHRRGLTELAPVQTDTFREAMSLLAGGVVGVTTRDSEGRPRGMLATAVTSYTDSPPSLLISAAHASRTHDPLVEAVGIGVHLLSQEQSDIASVLAGKADDKFAELEWEWDGDVPHIPGALAYMRCERAHTVTHYDHTIVIADVETTAIGEALPLIYFERSLGWQLVSPEA